MDADSNCRVRRILEKAGDQLPVVLWLFFTFFVFHYFKEISGGGNSWKTGDWLISYYGGAIRRGLIGTFLLYVSDYGISLRWLTFGLQVLVYGIVFFTTLRIYKMVRRERTWLLFLFSPAFLLFPVLDLQGGFRKEILVFLPFTLLCLVYSSGRLSAAWITIAGMLFAVAGFSHEMSAFLLPFFVYLLLIGRRDGDLSKRTAAIAIAGFAGISLAVLTFALMFKGEASMVPVICNTLLERGFKEGICDGAVAWLAHGAAYGFSEVKLRLGSYVPHYIPLFAIAVAPLFLTNWVNRMTTILMFGSLVCMAPLFIIAIDWGRWIHIWIFMVFSLLLSESVRHPIRIQSIPLFWLALYLTTWSMPHCGGGGFGPGLFAKFLSWAFGFAGKLVRLIN